MRKIIPWWVEAVGPVLLMSIGFTAAWYAGKYYPNWILEYQLAFAGFCLMIAIIILRIIIEIIWHDCGDDCRGRHNIEKIRSPYRKRK